MATFEADIEVVRLGSGAVVKFVDGRYEAVDQNEARWLRSVPGVTEVDAEDVEPQSKEPSEYEKLKAEAESLGIDTNGKSKKELAEAIEAAKAS